LKINLERRVFIGIPIGGKIKSILPSLKTSIHSSRDIIRWIPPENIHLTLSFLGNISDQDIPNIIQSIENCITSKIFKIIIESTGVFPSANFPKTLWIGIGKGADELTLLQKEIERSVRKFKGIYRREKFMPHITIARIRRSRRKIDVLPFLNTVYSPIELDINSICFYESILLPEGAQYMVLTEFPLN
jgi:2'-5' RNA ligase